MDSPSPAYYHLGSCCLLLAHTRSWAWSPGGFTRADVTRLHSTTALVTFLIGMKKPWQGQPRERLISAPALKLSFTVMGSTKAGVWAAGHIASTVMKRGVGMLACSSLSCFYTAKVFSPQGTQSRHFLQDWSRGLSPWWLSILPNWQSRCSITPSNHFLPHPSVVLFCVLKWGLMNPSLTSSSLCNWAWPWTESCCLCVLSAEITPVRCHSRFGFVGGVARSCPGYPGTYL